MIVQSPFPSSSDLSGAFQRLGNELTDFRDRVLPRLLDADGPEIEAFAWAATVMRDHSNDLSWTLAGRQSPFDEPPESGPTWHQVHAAVASARAVQDWAARRHLLCRRVVSDEELLGCRWDGRRVVWSLSAMVMPWPPSVLDDRGREIAEWLGLDAKNANDLRLALQDVESRRVVRVFRRMLFHTFYRLAQTIIRIAPDIRDAVLLVPTGRYGAAASGKGSRDSAGVTGTVSYLLGTAMEVRANNHFGMVWRTAVQREARGNWRTFMPGQVLDVLYRKWQVLVEFADRGVMPHCVVQNMDTNFVR